MLVAKTSWFKTKSYIIKEFAILIFLSIEKEAELVKYVIEKVVNNETSSNRSWQCSHEFIVFLYLSKPVICPIVFEMLIDLTIERVWQWLVLSKSSQQGHPIV